LKLIKENLLSPVFKKEISVTTLPIRREFLLRHRRRGSKEIMRFDFMG